ncbi:MAG: putative 2OG-Fe(II) oxygenase [Caulobacteraceae bacterium]
MSVDRKDAGTEVLQQAGQLLRSGRPLDAKRLLESRFALQPWTSDARVMLAQAFNLLGDAAGADAALRAGLKRDKGHEGLSLALADRLLAGGQASEAEKALRAVLKVNRRAPGAAVRLADLLAADGRAIEALHVTTPLVAAPTPEHGVLARHANTLKTLGRGAEALAMNERAAALYPASAVAQHNLAATLGDQAQFAPAEASALAAFRLGGDAPQTWLVYARALMGQGKLGQAQTAFEQAIRRRPDYVDAHRDLAQLIWMRTEDVAAATAALDLAIQAQPEAPGLDEVKATTLKYAGDDAGAYDVLKAALIRHPENASLRMSAAHAASLAGDPQSGLHHAEAAIALATEAPGPQLMLAELSLAVGDAARAAAVTERLLARNPLDQAALAYRATALRLLGDPRYQPDYDGLVGVLRMDTPQGWPDLDSYLADLTTALGGVHAFKTHPLDQSLRHGSQASNLMASSDPVISAFFQAVDGPIRRHLAALGTGEGPVRSRNRGGYDMVGAWSVRLRPGGFHTDHLHPAGWLSSACYIALPDAVQDANKREGWLKFGEPGIATAPHLPAERHVAPEPGRLVLFPSYMWHGTVPFTGDQPRLSIAFDLVPAAPRGAI